MKKLLAAVLAFVSVLSSSACGIKEKSLTPEEYQASLAAEASESVAASVKAEEKYSEGIAKNKKEIGKTVKNKKIVLQLDFSIGEHYQVWVMNKKGELDYILNYKFYDDPETYRTLLNYDDLPTEKKVDHDDEARMIVYKSTTVKKDSFDELYAAFDSKTAEDLGRKLIK